MADSSVGNAADKWIRAPIRKLGRIPISFVGDMGRMGLFLGEAIFYTFAPPLKFFRVLTKIQFIGFGSVLVIVLTGAFSGMVLGFQGYYTLARVGSTAFLGPNGTSLRVGDYEDFKKAAIDPYVALRDAYYQYRRNLVNGGEGKTARPAGPLPAE